MRTGPETGPERVQKWSQTPRYSGLSPIPACKQGGFRRNLAESGGIRRITGHMAFHGDSGAKVVQEWSRRWSKEEVLRGRRWCTLGGGGVHYPALLYCPVLPWYTLSPCTPGYTVFPLSVMPLLRGATRWCRREAGAGRTLWAQTGFLGLGSRPF